MDELSLNPSHLWEHFRHWIYSFFYRKLTDSQNIGTVRAKLISEEHVHEVDLEDVKIKYYKKSKDDVAIFF